MTNNTDWGLIQLQYEVFHEPVEKLAEEFGVSSTIIKYAVKEKNWNRVPLAKAVAEWTDYDNIQDVGEDLLEEVQKRMDIMRLIKQSALNPRYIAVEAAILSKGLALIQSISPDHPDASKQLKMVADTIKSLQEQNGTMSRQRAAADAEGSGTVKVQILNRVESTGKPTQQQGVEICVSPQPERSP